MVKIYDNIELKIENGIKKILDDPLNILERIDFCVGYFNLRGWSIVSDYIDKLKGGKTFKGSEISEDRNKEEHRYCRLLIGMHRPPEELIKQYFEEEKLIDENTKTRARKQIAETFRKQLLLGVPTNKDKQTLQKFYNQLKRGKVSVRLYIKNPLHAKLYLAYFNENSPTPIEAIMGSSNLTYSGFKGQGELNADFTDKEGTTTKLANWFDDRWNDDSCIDITEDLQTVINESWATERKISPYSIYIKTAYHLCEDVRLGIDNYSLSKRFEDKLLDFQKTAVKIVVKRLRDERFRGAMIGDVVGLGKTITACAVANTFNNRYGGMGIVICPANLVTMWEGYIKDYELYLNVISLDAKFKAEEMRAYNLIIIDESHNLRNEGQRYNKVKDFIAAQNDASVLLLTATPYNKAYRDLSRQLRLFISEDDDLGVRPEKYIASLATEKQPNGYEAFRNIHSFSPSSILAFEKSNFPEDWAELMKLFLVRRTRTFIKQNYAKEENGRKYLELKKGEETIKSFFPTRLPKRATFDSSPTDPYSLLYSETIRNVIDDLELPRYCLGSLISGKYVKDKKLTDLAYLLDVATRNILEDLLRSRDRMIGFCRSTLFKRLESSGYAFLLSVQRHIMRNMVFLYAIDEGLLLPIKDQSEMIDLFDGENDFDSEDTEDTATTIEYNFSCDEDYYRDKAEEYYNQIEKANKCKWIDDCYFKGELYSNLVADNKALLQILEQHGKWQPEKDSKLNALEKLLCGKHKKDKVLIFTQFTDTAEYLYEQLQKRGVEKIGMASGKDKDVKLKVLHFSPDSNKELLEGRNALTFTPENEIRVLIATDVLSEGQNLQDAHVIINFDLPWAIIRIIQRAGRVDRIGQQSSEILCYSFFPADGVEKIIHLREKLLHRLSQNAEAVGSDEKFFKDEKKSINNVSDLYNEKSGSLDDSEDDAEIDLSSQAYQVWLNAINANPKIEKEIKKLSNISYSAQATKNEKEEGIITYMRTPSGIDLLSWLNYKGEIISQAQARIFKKMACTPETFRQEPVEVHNEIVSQAVTNIRKMTKNAGIEYVGSKRSIKSRIISKIDCMLNSENSTFFTVERKKQLEKIKDDIYKLPLLEKAKNDINTAIKDKLTDEEIFKKMLKLHDNDNLINRSKETDDSSSEAEIICSMGLVFKTEEELEKQKNKQKRLDEAKRILAEKKNLFNN